MVPLVLGYILALNPPVVVVDRDNVAITQSCTIRVTEPVIIDNDRNGVIHVTADGVTVDFAGAALHGAAPHTIPDGFSGTGIRITAANVVIRGARVSGFKAGIWASDADGLLIEDCVVSDNFRQRLRSTPQAEDQADWLWPHANDANEWLARYGAGVYVEDSVGVTVRRVSARRTQNGIVLDRVSDSRIYDNDCSFLSGWGLALWRSSGNIASRNAFDFCIRGYSHGVYNRGQDSAGILMFEQCSNNVIAENSATHCGDGFFGFAGKEALGEVDPRDDLAWYKGRGNNNNFIVGNDFSDSAAHGIEMTFSFENYILSNRLVGNAICGIWGGYSQQTWIAHNVIESNGAMPYGLERGGVNIEHGHGNAIMDNAFKGNACGVYLWWDEDDRLMRLPWARVNEKGSRLNTVIQNTFDRDRVGVQLRKTTNTLAVDNTFTHVQYEFDLDELSSRTASFRAGHRTVIPEFDGEIFGVNRPVEAPRTLRGREHIIMTEWGPYDWQAPLLHLLGKGSGRHIYRLLGTATKLADDAITLRGEIDITRDGDRLTLQPRPKNTIVPYELAVRVGDQVLTKNSAVSTVEWEVRVFSYQNDPREDLDAWHAEAKANGVEARVGDLSLRYGMGGPSDLSVEEFRQAALGADHFGTIARTRFAIPPGSWKIRSLSDDGIRVWLDDTLVIDDWTWHPPTTHTYSFESPDTREISIRVEHFELDGYAVLTLDIEPHNPEP